MWETIIEKEQTRDNSSEILDMLRNAFFSKLLRIPRLGKLFLVRDTECFLQMFIE